MINKPLVSVVIPMYNQREGFLRECIESAIAQTYDYIEIVISNNHSTNNAPEVINEYASKDKRIRIVKPSEFLNISESFLYVFTQTIGEYICYVSSDDILMPTCVEVLVEKMEKNKNIVFSHGKAIYFTKDDSSSVNWKYFNEISGIYDLNREVAERLLSFSYICFGGLVVRNSVWIEMVSYLDGKNLKVDDFTDILMVTMLFRQGNVYFHNEVLAKVRMENDMRNQAYSRVIKDVASIWYLIENDEILAEKIKSTAINIRNYKETQFVALNRSVINEYFNGLIEFDTFKTAVKNLKLFNLKAPLSFSVFIKAILSFPKLSAKLYKAIKK
ncbi:MAG: glycosyl transferase family protein [Mucilaginibacter sp.]|nr:glycosyl transferase family protein [Mucilaginibacter sp.]